MKERVTQKCFNNTTMCMYIVQVDVLTTERATTLTVAWTLRRALLKYKLAPTLYASRVAFSIALD